MAKAKARKAAGKKAPKAKAKAKAKPAAKAAPKSGAKAASRSGAKDGAKIAPKPVAKAASKPGAKAASKSGAKAASKSGARLTPASGAKPASKSQAKAASKSKPKRKATPSTGVPATAGRAAHGSTGARGIELVERVIDKLAADGSDRRALTPAQLAALALSMPNGRPLPPSLARFLAFDADYLQVLEKDDTKLRFRSFLDMMAEEFDDATAEQYADLARALPGQCLVVPHGADSRRFMYVGEADELGEYPVLVVDTDELPWVGIAYPGLDVYLAEGTVQQLMKDTYLDAWRDKTYGPMLAEQARRNLHGMRALDYQQPEHIDGDEAAQETMAKLLGDVNPLTGALNPFTGEPED